ncbi:MAG: MinD/ParA family protein [Oscillospiraceae bacterium]|jgi:flagellar biosynthesis protein FlhG|nr:MinD/ParA family protein [Oscillospiraceae bacterium]
MYDRRRGDQAQGLRDRMSGSVHVPKVITVASGKGGVGKSTISVNLSIALSQMGKSVLVMDADFGLANVDIMLGVAAKYNISHFLRGEKTFPEIIQMGLDGVRFVSGGSGLDELLKMDEEQLVMLMSGLNKLDANIDYIICDAGAGINDNLLRMILASSETIVVTTPEPTAILDAYALIKTIVKRDKFHSIHIIMNRSESRREAERVLRGFKDVMNRNLGKDVDLLGHVLYDHDVPQSIKQQTPIIISQPEGRTARDIKAIALTLMNASGPQNPPNRLARLFARVMGTR